MIKYRVGIPLVIMFAVGATAAAAQTSATPTIVDLGKGKITGPFTFEAKDTSEVVMHEAVYDAAGVGHTWHSHPPLAVIVKSGSITIHTGDGSGCTSKTYTAGQALIDPGGVTHVHEGSPDLELQVTYVGVPAGAAVAKEEAAPTGSNCPASLKPGILRTELSRATIQGASRAAATGDSEMLMQLVTVPAGADFRGWYSSPAALFASMKSGSLTVFTGNATSCTSQTYTAGQGLFVPAGQVIFVRNQGSAPAEVYATRLALPVGAAPRIDAQNPGGANCPDIAGGVAQPAPGGQLPRSGGDAAALVMLGLGLAGIGTAACAFGRRR